MREGRVAKSHEEQLIWHGIIHFINCGNQSRVRLGLRKSSADSDEGKEFSIGGAVIRPVITCVSKKALDVIRGLESARRHRLVKGNGVRYVSSEYGGEYALRFEHMVPIKVIRERLERYYAACKNRSCCMDRDYVKRLLSLCNVALIHPDEDKILNKKFKDCIPGELEVDKPFDLLRRYREAGLGDKIWASVEDF